MRRIYYFSAVLILLILFSIILVVYQQIMDISQIPGNGHVQNLTDKNDKIKKVIYVGVVSRFSPNLIYEGYQPIMNYLSRETKYDFKLKLSTSYEETVTQLIENKVQIAFLGTFIYLKSRNKYPLKCILKPLNSQFEPFFRSIIITRTDSPYCSVADLKNARLALTSTASFSGNWLPRFELKKYGIKISDLDSVHYFDHHHTVIYQILVGNFDVGVVKDRVANEFMDKGIRFIASSEPIPGSPVVVKTDLDQDIVDSFSHALLKINVTIPEYKDLVKNWDREFAFGFTEAREEDYDRIESIIDAVGDDL